MAWEEKSPASKQSAGLVVQSRDFPCWRWRVFTLIDRLHMLSLVGTKGYHLDLIANPMLSVNCINLRSYSKHRIKEGTSIAPAGEALDRTELKLIPTLSQSSAGVVRYCGQGNKGR